MMNIKTVLLISAYVKQVLKASKGNHIERKLTPSKSSFSGSHSLIFLRLTAMLLAVTCWLKVSANFWEKI